MAPLTVVSLFSGGGGLDYGLAMAGFRTRLAVEQEQYACKVLRDAKALQHRLPDGHSFLEECEVWEGDIAELSGERALELARLRPGEATVVVGGPPCITFSVAGRRQGLGHDTGRLYQHYIRLLKSLNPLSFIFENVSGILSAIGTDGDDRPAFDVILGELEAAGYTTTWRTIDAADYGVPQHRRRVIILGRRGGSEFEFPSPTYADPRKLELYPGRRPWRTVRHAFFGLPPAVLVGEAPKLANHVAKRHSAGTIESYRATAPGKRNPRHKRDRLLWHAPGKTVRAQGKVKSDGSRQKHSSVQALHPDEPRQLTARECARLQTFPDWYPFPDTLVNAYRIIGDAVPCELAQRLGESMERQLGPQGGE